MKKYVIFLALFFTSLCVVKAQYITPQVKVSCRVWPVSRNITWIWRANI